MPSLYCAYFQLEETPFSMAPDPRFVFLSERHREALGHLLFGLAEGGGFVQFTGEVGTGKTTICRTMLCQLPDNVDVALIFNPKLTVPELLQSICEELRVELPEDMTSTKAFVDRLYGYLLDANAKGRRTVLIIDEAQNLSREVLEQIRLLTNLETNENKLLQIFLIGQPELRTMLGREDLRQLAQRITARYHLEPLTRAETSQYIVHRLSVAGCLHKVFTDAAQRKVFHLTGGVPRLINNLCDRALLGAYVTSSERVDARIVARANRELHGISGWSLRVRARVAAVAGILVGAAFVAILAVNSGQLSVAQMVSSVRSSATSVDDGALEPVTNDSKHAGAGLNSAGSPSVESQPKPSPARTLQETIDAALNGSTRDPEQRLLALWGIQEPAENGQLCRRAVDNGRACLLSAGSWNKLRGFDLPALLSLKAGNGETIKVLLVGLAGQDATLYVGDEEEHFPLHEVDRYWTGDFLVLWKPPVDGVTVIRESHSGKSVRWLRKTLAQADGIHGDVGDDSPVDQELSTRIKNYQRRHGLNADGVAGPETLIHLGAMGKDRQMPTLSAVGGVAQTVTEQAVTRLSRLTSK